MTHPCTTLSIAFLSLTLVSTLSVMLLLNNTFTRVPSTPNLTPRWWGPSDRNTHSVEDQSIKPFTFTIDEEALIDLKLRIRSDLVRLSSPLQSSSFQYGFNTDYLQDLAEYWISGFDWKEQENSLNSFPQYITDIDGLRVHFLHVKSQIEHCRVSIPLLLVHGWPGSVIEFLDIIPLLTGGKDGVCLEVVAPSIPGYGFSSAPYKQGFNAKEAAGVFHQLMSRLGHQKFIAQGGDWGSLITTHMAALFPESVIGLHINMAGVLTQGDILRTLLSGLPGLGRILVDTEDLDKVSTLKDTLTVLLRETGYMHLQATKPDTVGVGLSNSPLGLAAYILEKFSTWTEPRNIQLENGGLERIPISRDRMLANVMIYWFTNSITSSLRFYKENFPVDWEIASIPISSPVGFSDFPNELLRIPRSCMLGKFPNLVQYTRQPRGGHFAAMEQPHLLAEDILNFVTLVVNTTEGGREEL